MISESEVKSIILIETFATNPKRKGEIFFYLNLLRPGYSLCRKILRSGLFVIKISG